MKKSLIYWMSFAWIILACSAPVDKKYAGWENYGGTKEMIRYSSLVEVDTSNVSTLQVAWTYHTGDADTLMSSQIQCNPIVIDGILYGVSPQMKLFAVDAATGVEKWKFNPNEESYHNVISIRGMAYWTDGKGDRRLFVTFGSNTFAINADTGKPVPTFGNNGSIDLHDDLGRDVSRLYVVNTSPGVIFKNLLILGMRADEALPAAPGPIRAYDVRSGKLQWIFHTIPQPGEFGYETWEQKDAWKYIGGANVWSGFSLDEKRGIVFASTGSAAYDFYGGNRRGSNLFANCLIALDAATGKRIWHFQFVHHDIWDMDLPTPPALITVMKDGKQVEAVAQTTKQGMIYVFERENGKPIFEIEEVPMDTVSDLKGEKVWPTQPIPKKPAPFARQTLTSDDYNPYAPDSSRNKIIELMKGYRYGKMFIPPGTKSSLVFPGYDGGAEWGGPAFDPETGIIYVNANQMAWVMNMQENKLQVPKQENRLQAGTRLYAQYCSACHGQDRKGTGNNPALLGLNKKYGAAEFMTLINGGRRMMPSFGQLDDEQKMAIASYLLEQKSEQQKPFVAAARTEYVNLMPYKMLGYTKFLTPEGYPAISPPWGTFSAINLNTGDLVWKVVLGEYEELKAKGIPATGTENYGGPVVTAGGIVFIAASRDGKLRAFNKRNGKLLWEYQLPAAGFATPSVYKLNGKQYLVIACGGGKLGTKSGDAYVAFALP